ncbi:MAG TPA: hypothetical protein VNV41_11080 [Candidatus Acidoferrales bacterium]|jgi:hypothetical protein|nr:hypothetical protein [Candidatus Acidoferrales bacterium]
MPRHDSLLEDVINPVLRACQEDGSPEAMGDVIKICAAWGIPEPRWLRSALSKLGRAVALGIKRRNKEGTPTTLLRDQAWLAIVESYTENHRMSFNRATIALASSIRATGGPIIEAATIKNACIRAKKSLRT